MSRVNTLRKLLSFGDLHRSQIDLAMGGDSFATEDALAELTKSGEVVRKSSSYGVTVFHLRDIARARAFAHPIEATVLVRQRVQIINFPEVSAC